MRGLLIGALLLLTTPSLAAPLRERLEVLLSGYEMIPTREDLLRLGPGMEAVLREVAEHPSRKALARNRAIALLQLFPSPTTEATLRRVMTRHARGRGGVELLDLQRALAAYAVVAGPRSLPVLAPFLAHASLDVRQAATVAVAHSRSPRARQLLQQRRQAEPSATVRHHLDREIARLAR